MKKKPDQTILTLPIADPLKILYDPCRRPFFSPSVADDLRVRLWLPNRDRVEILTSDIFPKFHATDLNVFALGMLVGEENIASYFFGTN